MKEIDLAYTAGMLGGEGSIIISSSKRNYSTTTHSLRVVICNTQRTLMDWLLRHYGGHVHPLRRIPDKQRPNEKVVWTWGKAGIEAGEFLKPLMPYLLLKRKQVELAIEFSGLVRVKGKGTRNLTSEEWANRERLKQAVSALNKRGCN